MSKKIKVVLIIISIFIGILLFDRVLLSLCNKSLLSFKTEVPYKYSGLYYDVFYCPNYEKPKVLYKNAKFACENDDGKIKNIINKSNDIKNFECIPYIEEFFKDEEYTYYFKCKISEYVYVEYMNGYEEKVIDAINRGVIGIIDLDEFDIEYTKIPRK